MLTEHGVNCRLVTCIVAFRLFFEPLNDVSVQPERDLLLEWAVEHSATHVAPAQHFRRIRRVNGTVLPLRKPLSAPIILPLRLECSFFILFPFVDCGLSGGDDSNDSFTSVRIGITICTDDYVRSSVNQAYDAIAVFITFKFVNLCEIWITENKHRVSKLARACDDYPELWRNPNRIVPEQPPVMPQG